MHNGIKKIGVRSVQRKNHFSNAETTQNNEKHMLGALKEKIVSKLTKSDSHLKKLKWVLTKYKTISEIV